MGICLCQKRNDVYFRRDLMPVSQEERAGWSPEELSKEKCGLCLRSSGAGSKPDGAI